MTDIVKTDRFVLYREIIVGYSKNHTKQVSIRCGHNAKVLNVTLCTTCSYSSAESQYKSHFLHSRNCIISPETKEDFNVNMTRLTMFVFMT
jgi:ribosomal protein L37E